METKEKGKRERNKGRKMLSKKGEREKVKKTDQVGWDKRGRKT
jgi:hypothetical protein